LLRPVLNIDEVTAFLEEWSGGSVAGVSQFSNGQVSSVFGFEVKGGDRSGKYVVRFVSQENSGGLKKDRIYWSSGGCGQCACASFAGAWRSFDGGWESF
jgi:hypothetical protein